jgi:hypothetical protein
MRRASGQSVPVTGYSVAIGPRPRVIRLDTSRPQGIPLAGARCRRSPRRWHNLGESWQAGKKDVAALALMIPSIAAEITPLL